MKGIFTYDRDEVKLLEEGVQAMHAKLCQVFAQKVTK